jgi:hypothetical protein
MNGTCGMGNTSVIKPGLDRWVDLVNRHLSRSEFLIKPIMLLIHIMFFFLEGGGGGGGGEGKSENALTKY